MEEYAVIVAGGSGTRMKSKLPKQFIEVGSLPILMHTINQFRKYAQSIQIILVLPENQFDIWSQLCQKFQFSVTNLVLVKGGQTRYQSCKNGIEYISNSNSLVAIHDGVRPFVSIQIIANGYRLAKENGAAVCCVPSKDSVRYVSENGESNQALDRTRIKVVQTPQVFKIDILKKAYSFPELSTFTDDASVVEHSQQPIFLFDGDYTNIKITTDEDLILAEMILKSN